MIQPISTHITYTLTSVVLFWVKHTFFSQINLMQNRRKKLQTIENLLCSKYGRDSNTFGIIILFSVWKCFLNILNISKIISFHLIIRFEFIWVVFFCVYEWICSVPAQFRLFLASVRIFYRWFVSFS